jgi:hypothetical protein
MITGLGAHCGTDGPFIIAGMTRLGKGAFLGREHERPEDGWTAPLRHIPSGRCSGGGARSRDRTPEAPNGLPRSLSSECASEAQDVGI